MYLRAHRLKKGGPRFPNFWRRLSTRYSRACPRTRDLFPKLPQALHLVARLNIGLIGCGFIGRFHSIAIRYLIKQGLIDARYAAVCDLDEARARSFAEPTGSEGAGAGFEGAGAPPFLAPSFLERAGAGLRSGEGNIDHHF